MTPRQSPKIHQCEVLAEPCRCQPLSRWVDPSDAAAVLLLLLDSHSRRDQPVGQEDSADGSAQFGCVGQLLKRRRLKRKSLRIADRGEGRAAIDVSSDQGRTFELAMGGGRTTSLLPHVVQQSERGATTPPMKARSGRCVAPPLPTWILRYHVAPFLRFEAPLDNMLYVLGGRCGQTWAAVDEVEMLDTWHGCWVRCPPMPQCRAGSASTAVHDGRIFVFGGYDERGPIQGILDSVDVYDPVTECWSPRGTIAPMSRARWGLGCVCLSDKVYICGGCSEWQALPVARNRRPQELMETLCSCESFDLTTGRWHSCSPMRFARSGHRLVAIDKQRFAAVGGCIEVFGASPRWLSSIEVFDTATGVWSMLEQGLARPRTCAAVASVNDGQILAAGGAADRDTLLSSAEVFTAVPTAAVGDEEIHSSSALPSLDGNAAPSRIQVPRDVDIPDLPQARMGCQGAIVNLPRPGRCYPNTSSRCFIVVGGEVRGEKDRQLFLSALDLEALAWRHGGDEHGPPLPPAVGGPRTAVAICVGVGRVSTARVRDSASVGHASPE